MRIDRSHFPWFILTLLLSVGCVALYLANHCPEVLPFPFPLPSFLGSSPPRLHSQGATPLGLIFGSLALGIFLFAAALGIRKKRRRWSIGKTRFWLKAHIWLTILTVPLVLLHCGFRVQGIYAQWLMFLYAVVMVSGFVGLGLQHFLPRMMKDQLPREVVFEQIPYLRGQILLRVHELRESLRSGHAPQAADLRGDQSAKVLGEFLDAVAIPYLDARSGRNHRLGSDLRAKGVFASVRVGVGPEWRLAVDRVEGWCEERRWMDRQTRFQHWLHGWLIFHVPTSFGLLVVTIWHGWSSWQFLVFR